MKRAIGTEVRPLARRLAAAAAVSLGIALLTACAANQLGTTGRATSSRVPPQAPNAPQASAPETAPPAASPIISQPTETQVATPTAPSTSAAPEAPVAPEAPTALPSADSVVDGSPHFDTPEAAMRYLVAAYNSHDPTAEMHVTTPAARDALESERQWVNAFSFNSCAPSEGNGDYSCQFDMASKVRPDDADADMGEITVLVAPAARPGWYMHDSLGCGDGEVSSTPSA